MYSLCLCLDMFWRLVKNCTEYLLHIVLGKEVNPKDRILFIVYCEQLYFLNIVKTQQNPLMCVQVSMFLVVDVYLISLSQVLYQICVKPHFQEVFYWLFYDNITSKIQFSGQNCFFQGSLSVRSITLCTCASCLSCWQCKGWCWDAKNFLIGIRNMPGGHFCFQIYVLFCYSICLAPRPHQWYS